MHYVLVLFVECGYAHCTNVCSDFIYVKELILTLLALFSKCKEHLENLEKVSQSSKDENESLYNIQFEPCTKIDSTKMLKFPISEWNKSLSPEWPTTTKQALTIFK